jgi:Family of unknown function (DUF5985)
VNQTAQVAIYVLCLLASTTCTWLLLRGYRRTLTRLLLWVGLCFAFLSLNSLAVLFDLLILPQWDLRVWRHVASLTAVCVLLFGLVWESE